MPEKMTRERFCEICKEYGLEVVCEDNVYGPNTKHASASLRTPIIAKDDARTEFAEWDCPIDDPLDYGPSIGFYDALRKDRQGTYYVSTSDLTCLLTSIGKNDSDKLRVVLKQVSSALHRLEEDPTYRPDEIVFSTSQEHYNDNPRT